MGFTRYITRKRARFTAYGGRPVNIPWGTALTAKDRDICLEGMPLCCVTSENAHRFFAQNDDGLGIIRGKLVGAILDKLEQRDKNHQDRWDRLWADPLANQYRDPSYDDFWLWGQSFYGAPVHDLQHIAAIVGV